MNGWYDVRPNRCIGNNQSMRIADPAELHKKLLEHTHTQLHLATAQWKLGHRKPMKLTAVSFIAYGVARFDS